MDPAAVWQPFVGSLRVNGGETCDECMQHALAWGMPEELNPDKMGPAIGIGLAIGAGLGASLGSAFGAAMGDVASGIIFGIPAGSGIGLAIGIIFSIQKQKGVCSHCGYATRGLPAASVCPECGRAISPEDREEADPPETV